MSCLKIKDYQAWVSLGCSKEEQSFVQPVLLNISFYFSTPVKAEASDTLSDSIDYVQLIQIVDQACNSKSFNMVEHLAGSIAYSLSENLKNNFKGDLEVSVLKVRVPVKNIQTGVEWTCKVKI